VSISILTIGSLVGILNLCRSRLIVFLGIIYIPLSGKAVSDYWSSLSGKVEYIAITPLMSLN
jgi:hypothetical protein